MGLWRIFATRVSCRPVSYSPHKPMDFADYRRHDGIGLAELVADGEVSPAELLATARERAEAVNPSINAIVRWLDRQADARVADPDALRGPFAGVPFLIKDLLQNYAGEPTSEGSRSLASLPRPEHSTVVKRWLAAGLVIFGKTNTPEFGAKGITEPALYGPARNPWDLSRTPGGSSGGAAAAVAAGIVPAAGASDGGGSIRIPAACCGLFGLKASRGLIPADPLAGELLFGAATDGVISRTVRDSARMLDVLAGPGPDPAAPYLPAPPADSYEAAAANSPERLRVGVYSGSAINPNPDREALAAVEQATRYLDDLGHEVVELSEAPFDDAALAKDFLTIWFANAAHMVDEIKAMTGCGDEGFELETRVMAAIGKATGAVPLMRALERRQEYVAALAGFHENHDLLLTPTLATPPPTIGEFDMPRSLRLASRVVLALRGGRLLTRLGVVDDIIEDNLSWVPYTQLANLTGRPAASLPLHWTAEGLPIGVQLVAPLGGETTLLALAAQIEEAFPWAERSPVAEPAS